MTRPALLSLDEAMPQLLAQAKPLEAKQTISTFDADGRVLAQDVVAALQVPPQDNSSMDGYAVRTADCAQAGAVLRVTQRIPAGTYGTPLNAGETARIFTGAPIPLGADAVVMQEDCEVLEGEKIKVSKSVPPAQWIRRSGEDVKRGAKVLTQGMRLTPAELGLAASIGLAQLQVSARPRVALFSTGDELVMPGDVAPEAMPAGAIYNSNRFFLRAMLQRLGCEVTDLGIVPDKREATIAAMREAAQHHDLILTSGGVSVGEEDHIKPAVEALGELNLWQLAIKPGKPFAYGKVNRGFEGDACHFMGLPGNPVSSFVTFLLLVRPFVLALQGVTQTEVKRTEMTAHFDWPRADKRREFLRVKRNAQGGLDLFPNQSSGVLTSAVWGDGVVDNPAGQTISKGDTVRFISFAEWLA
ncbi:gephyrin-like molybdotransferase Glp [Limnohabitans sp. B9-3]|uniref:molybdopterin molybdotransferase MoeA n=1 Tax=Limnohabitans sp. B9-3 TaxID=1100707 RepID=UPI000C1F25F1|nr:gephyrin-like molybdotransferase Glp [Limnohabitans sp. B9-3]PIT71482.1 molybdopterin molybdenumtransferase MoeA [Limnohabitans sp. B9-3]